MSLFSGMVLLLFYCFAAVRKTTFFVVWGMKKELFFLCQMVVGVEKEKKNLTPSVNKGCGPFWPTGRAFGQLASLALAC